MLKIKDNVDLKELEKYDFVKLENNYRGHKYSWKENTFGITEQSHELLEVNAKVIATDQDYLEKSDK